MSTPHLPLPIPPLSTLRAALAAFKASTSPFRILHSTSTPSPSPSPSPPQSQPLSTSPYPDPLYILDSSFNPPTTAHLSIATSTFPSPPTSPFPSPPTPHHILLLLATQNADKSPSTTPAPLEHRLAMMALLAVEIVARAPSSSSSSSAAAAVRVDVGVTREAYFHAKAGAIAGSGAYAAAAAAEEEEKDLGENHQPASTPPSLEQVYLVGFDTLVRLLDPKYYPPTHTLAPLGGFFARARVRVTRRVGGRWGGREVQDGFLEGFEWGKKGGRREWGGRVEVVGGGREGAEVVGGGREGVDGGGEGVSSSLVREKVGKGEGGWEGLVGEGVRTWIVEEGLYGREEGG